MSKYAEDGVSILEGHSFSAFCGKITKEPTPQIRIVSKYSGHEIFYYAK